MNNEKLDELYKKTEILLSECMSYIDNESDEYIAISGYLINIMKEINLARIKSITNKVTNVELIK